MLVLVVVADGVFDVVVNDVVGTFDVVEGTLTMF